MKTDDLPNPGSNRILEKALAMVGEALPDRGRLCDLPCGTGYLSVRATQEGWTVQPYDLLPELWEGGSEAKVRHADLCKPLPIDSDEFDALCCCEGIEHLENPWLALREIHRIVRPGGSVVISIPNTIDIRQRVRVLRQGFYGHYMPTLGGHINLNGTFGLCHALLMSGYRIEAVGQPKTYGSWWMKILARFFRLGKRCGLPAQVRAMLSEPSVLCARTVVILARVLKDPNHETRAEKANGPA